MSYTKLREFYIFGIQFFGITKSPIYLESPILWNHQYIWNYQSGISQFFWYICWYWSSVLKVSVTIELCCSLLTVCYNELFYFYCVVHSCAFHWLFLSYFVAGFSKLLDNCVRVLPQSSAFVMRKDIYIEKLAIRRADGPNSRLSIKHKKKHGKEKKS